MLQMESYVFKRRNDGVFIFNLHKTWEKLMLAARVIAAIENPADICVISGRELGQVWKRSISYVLAALSQGWRSLLLRSFSG